MKANQVTKNNKASLERRSNKSRVRVDDLVRTIGYQLTAFIGGADIRDVEDWLNNGLPKDLEARMRATLDVAMPIKQVESELVAQGFLIEKTNELEPYGSPAQMLRAGDVPLAREVLMERVRREFLNNVAGDLEDVERRLKKWISRAILPPKTAYSVSLSSNKNRLSLQLIHAGFSVTQLRRWDRGESWPFWEEVILDVPEMAAARTVPDRETGFPFKYLRRADN
jgi:hypothetical protein